MEHTRGRKGNVKEIREHLEFVKNIFTLISEQFFLDIERIYRRVNRFLSWSLKKGFMPVADECLYKSLEQRLQCQQSEEKRGREKEQVNVVLNSFQIALCSFSLHLHSIFSFHSCKVYLIVLSNSKNLFRFPGASNTKLRDEVKSGAWKCLMKFSFPSLPGRKFCIPDFFFFLSPHFSTTALRDFWSMIVICVITTTDFVIFFF